MLLSCCYDKTPWQKQLTEEFIRRKRVHHGWDARKWEVGMVDNKDMKLRVHVFKSKHEAKERDKEVAQDYKHSEQIPSDILLARLHLQRFHKVPKQHHQQQTKGLNIWANGNILIQLTTASIKEHFYRIEMFHVDWIGSLDNRMKKNPQNSSNSMNLYTFNSNKSYLKKKNNLATLQMLSWAILNAWPSWILQMTKTSQRMILGKKFLVYKPMIWGNRSIKPIGTPVGT